MKDYFIRIIKYIFQQLGISIVRWNKNPYVSLLGVKNYPIRTIIDVGANDGQYAKEIIKHFPEASIYCFEPLEENFSNLNNWAAVYRGQIKTYKTALGENEADVTMYRHLEHSPSSSFLKTTDTTIELYPHTKSQNEVAVNLITLDKAIDKFGINLLPDVLIKLDVQGYEDRVIRGGQNTFAQAKACILEINLDVLYNKQAEFQTIMGLMNNLKFRYAGNLTQIYAVDGHVVYIDAVFIK